MTDDLASRLMPLPLGLLIPDLVKEQTHQRLKACFEVRLKHSRHATARARAEICGSSKSLKKVESLIEAHL